MVALPRCCSASWSRSRSCCGGTTDSRGLFAISRNRVRPCSCPWSDPDSHSFRMILLLLTGGGAPILGASRRGLPHEGGLSEGGSQEERATFPDEKLWVKSSLGPSGPSPELKSRTEGEEDEEVDDAGGDTGAGYGGGGPAIAQVSGGLGQESES